MIALFVLAIGAAPVDIVLEVDPPAEPCLFATRVPAAIERLADGARMVSIEARAGSSLEGGRRALLLSLVSGAGGVRVALSRADGTIVLERTLESTSDACRAIADGVALIVDRYLRDLGGAPSAEALPETAPEPREASAPPEATPPEPREASAEGAAIAEVASSTAAPPARGVELELAAFGAIEGPSASGARGAAAVSARIGLGPGEVRVLAQYHAPQAVELLRGLEPRAVGSIRTWSASFTGSLAACLERARFRVCGGGGAGFERTQARAQSVFSAREAVVLRPIATASVRLDWRVWEPVRLSAEVESLIRLSPARFSVEGADTGYQDPDVTALFRLGGWVQVL